MLLDAEYDFYQDFDLINFIVLWMNFVETQQTKRDRWPSEQKLDFVLAKVEGILSPREYRNNETLLVIVISALVKMGKHPGLYRVKTKSHCCVIS
jgi:hypothetical protein